MASGQKEELASFALEKLIGVKSESGELISEQVVKCYQNYECLKENANDKMRFSVNH